jgi:hypothetical protein
VSSYAGDAIEKNRLLLADSALESPLNFAPFLVNEPASKSFRELKAETFHLRKVVSDNGNMFLTIETFFVRSILVRLLSEAGAERELTK